MAGLKVALGSIGMTVEAARKIGVDGCERCETPGAYLDD